MARAGIFKSEVLRARNQLQAEGRYPSIDAIRAALGDTGSKGTIHRHLKEIEQEEGVAALGSKVMVSEAIQDLVGRLAERLREEADERVTVAQGQHATALAAAQRTVSTLQAEVLASRQQTEQGQRQLVEEKAQHSRTQEALRLKTQVQTQSIQELTVLRERLAADERFRASLEEKHQHAREALEHFRNATREQREQDQRAHEQQVQYLQAELRTLKEQLAMKQHEALHAHQENTRVQGEFTRAQADLHLAREELRRLHGIEAELAFAHRRTDELGRRVVEQEAAVAQLDVAKAELHERLEQLLTARHQQDVALATANASLAAQEHVVASMLERINTLAAAPDVDPGYSRSTGANSLSKRSIGTKT